MIPKVHKRGRRVGGLLRYLYGPGKHEEHRNPHLVAAWEGAGELASLEPVTTTAGRPDFRRLTELLEIPVEAGRTPPGRPVWHCSIRTHPDDPTLTDAQWRDISAAVMARAGLAPAGDDRAVRWLAVRHADDHIHLVATLVRQDRRTCWARNDYPLTQAACRDLEQQYGLYRVGQPGQGTRAWPTSNELNKSTRRGRRVAPREELRRRVRTAATVAVDQADFVTRLTHDGTVTIRFRHSTRDPDQVTGCSVALTGDTTAAGEPIFHSGGKLAADLSLTRLRRRWDPDTTLAGSDRRAHQLRPTPAEVYLRAATLVIDAANHIVTGDNRATSGVIGAAADLLAAMAGAREGASGGPLTRAAELFDRANHQATTPLPRRTGYSLRAIARMLSTTSSAERGSRDLQAMLRLVAALAGLADAVADFNAAGRRLAQADAARSAAANLRTYRPTMTVNAPTPNIAMPTAAQGRSHPARPRR